MNAPKAIFSKPDRKAVAVVTGDISLFAIEPLDNREYTGGIAYNDFGWRQRSVAWTSGSGA